MADEQKAVEKKKPKRKGNDHTVFVGNSAFMNYVTAVVMQFTTKGAKEVEVCARGKFISRAVDIAEVASKRFLEGKIEISNIEIDSEQFKNKEGEDVRVSSIKIVLKSK